MKLTKWADGSGQTLELENIEKAKKLREQLEIAIKEGRYEDDEETFAIEIW